MYLTCLPLNSILYFYDQNDGHVSHRFFTDTANNFLLIYGDLGDLLEKSILEISSGLVVKVQYVVVLSHRQCTSTPDLASP